MCLRLTVSWEVLGYQEWINAVLTRLDGGSLSLPFAPCHMRAQCSALLEDAEPRPSPDINILLPSSLTYHSPELQQINFSPNVYFLLYFF
jgi:hypothetical protein